MSCVVTQPDSLTKVATDPCEVHPERAAADEVSALTATQFEMNAQTHQPVSDQAASVHQVAATTMASRVGSSAANEAANVIAAG